MRMEVERMSEYYKTVKKEQVVDANLIKMRDIEATKKYGNMADRNREIEQKNMAEFKKYGIMDLFTDIADKKIVIQDDSFASYGGIEKAKYKFSRHCKKCSLVFDKYKGNDDNIGEFGHRITITLPTNNGINIHGYENGERIIRNRIEFDGKENSEIQKEISMAVFEQIVTLQGYKFNRVDFDKLMIE